ncbi:alpha/beta fold hydrolase [Candidatus Methylobacter oryzae]|uniref:Alpha/beta fold hydrolase n=1 Tax=Candidatus Methylobacter oryzae TaxID=2497749 RepID=A0ABY3C7N9_9GAMM|nr:alpha/beta fold hydrolase [Candidatus Methylobacter oryzae]TRW92095.1 alpha/beta fold hydrolase [Candidatus Methylobacter oryzae]
MNKAPYQDDWPDIDTKLYNRSVKLFNAVKNILSVRLDLHTDPQVVLEGDIFLFNHFSRFETFIPQFLIYEKTGAYSCSIASGEFFKEDNVLSRYLKRVGVFPHSHERLFPLLAGQILRGRKVIIFPEGGMVKDRRVIDKHGHYSIFSRITGNRRKHHTGPAVLSQGVETFKAAVRHAHSKNDIALLRQWKDVLHIDSIDQLIAVANKPTLMVPANITFYPIRSSENLLFKSVELFSDGLSLRQSEELLIEGNIMLENTDMDIRMGTPVNPCSVWNWRSHYLVGKVALEINTIDDVFTLNSRPQNWRQRLLGADFINNAQILRDRYMEGMYANVTVNLSHLAATLIMYYVGQGQSHIEKGKFYRILYIAIKSLQSSTVIHLHRSLLNPDDYSDLFKATNKRFEHFISAAKEAGLINEDENNYQFLPKLCVESDFDSIRLENPIVVYNNEAAPLHTVRDTLIDAIAECSVADKAELSGLSAQTKLMPVGCKNKLAAWHFEDECRTLAWEKQAYSKPVFVDINGHEIAVADPTPFFVQPKVANGIGVLLVHGLLASPAELRAYGDYLVQQGYMVIGVRLKGHGTSPYALRDQTWEDWYGCVQRGFDILKAHCSRIFAVGFSTGGALALKLAAEQPPEILGVTAISVPLRFVNPAYMLVPLLHGTNTLVGWVSAYEGVKPFIENEPEHPNINYHNIPVRALYELRRLIAHIDELLPKISLPILILYGDQDPIVSPKSAPIIMERLGSAYKQIQAIKSQRHGILMENIDGTWRVIDKFFNELKLS